MHAKRHCPRGVVTRPSSACGRSGRGHVIPQQLNKLTKLGNRVETCAVASCWRAHLTDPPGGVAFVSRKPPERSSCPACQCCSWWKSPFQWLRRWACQTQSKTRSRLPSISNQLQFQNELMYFFNQLDLVSPRSQLLCLSS